MKGRFGLGYDVDLNGVNMRYYFGNLGIDFTLGFGLKTATAAGQTTRIDLSFSPKIVYALKLHKVLHLNLSGGVFFQVLGSNNSGQTDMNISFFFGMGPELILFERLAVEIFFGVAANINNLMEKGAKTHFSFGTIGQRLNVVSGAQFRYYF